MENSLGRCTHCSIQMWWALLKAATLSPPGGHSCTRRLGTFEFSLLKLALLNWNFLQTIFYFNKTVHLISHLNYFATFLLLKSAYYILILTYRVVIEFNTLAKLFLSIRLHQNVKKIHTLMGVRARRLVVWVTHVRLEMIGGRAV